MKIILKNRFNQAHKILEFDQESVVIGRSTEADLLLDSKTVSRRHAELKRVKADWYILDLESGNGTYLDNEKLKPHHQTALQQGSHVRIEEFDLVFEFPKEEEKKVQDDFTDPEIMEIKLLKKVLSTLEKEKFPYLELLHSDKKKLILDDSKETWLLGRSPEADLQLNAELISRDHARIEKKWSGFLLIDLGSKNGVRVNQEKISEHLLKDGDLIQISDFQILFKSPASIDIEDLAKDYQGKKKTAAIPQAVPISENAQISLGEKKEEEKNKKEEIEEKESFEDLLQDETPARPVEKKPTPLQKKSSKKSKNLPSLEIVLVLFALGILFLAVWILMNLI